MYTNENQSGYYDLMIAIIMQAIEDFCWVNRKKKKILNSDKLDEQGLSDFLHNMFSDESKIDAIMKQAKKLRDSGAVSVYQWVGRGEQNDY